jgi:prepilin-type processing-associated H-X9-DG protein
VGQPAQQGALEGNAGGLPVRRPGQARAVHDQLSRAGRTGRGFEKSRETGIADFTDGTSNTVLVVEAKEAALWTKPDDLTFDPAAAPSLYGAGSPHTGGFNAGFADGSVRFIKNTIERLVFKNLVTRNGGEVVGAGSF